MVGDRERALGQLEGKGRIYAVLDGARDPRVGRLTFGSAPSWCLYRGKLPQGLADAAPQLLHLHPGHDSADIFFRIGWRNSWGILLACGAPRPILYRHLRSFLLVRSEGGKSLVFRYYDPRILRRYLPTCTPAEMERFFGPVSAIVAEAQEEGQLHLFRRAEGGFEHLRIEAEGAARSVQTWPAAEAPTVRGRVVLRQAQLQALADPGVRAYEDRMVAWIAKEFEDEFERLEERGVRRLVSRAIESAKNYGMASSVEVTGLLSLMLILGDDFEGKEENGWMRDILRSKSIPSAQKARMILEQRLAAI